MRKTISVGDGRLSCGESESPTVLFFEEKVERICLSGFVDELCLLLGLQYFFWKDALSLKDVFIY